MTMIRSLAAAVLAFAASAITPALAYDNPALLTSPQPAPAPAAVPAAPQKRCENKIVRVKNAEGKTVQKRTRVCA